jgi:haloacetate dehalogenase
MAAFDAFEPAAIDVDGVRLFTRRAGSGPPLLLLHGFPETHLMWRDVAPLLARDFTVVCADLRGYGASDCPPSAADHSTYSKRSLASDMVGMMRALGFAKFSVAGHDRGGRVAYRLALDRPEVVERVAVLDVIPTLVAWERADAEFAQSFWPWSMLAQPAPLPEEILQKCAGAIVDDALDGWGPVRVPVPEAVRAAYVAALAEPAHARAICEEYRAAATLDREHDAADRTAGRRIDSPLLVLWSTKGVVERGYRDLGGPLGVWRGWACDVSGQGIDAGHFFPEEDPAGVARLLGAFFDAGDRTSGRYI